MLTSDRQRDFIDINLGRKFNIGLEYEVFHMLDFRGGECNHDTNYDLDLCAHKDLLQVSSNQEFMYMVLKTSPATWSLEIFNPPLSN